MSELLMKALIYRRIEVVAQGMGDALLIGSAHSAATLRIKAVVSHNWIDGDGVRLRGCVRSSC
jgi:thioredoxin reductase (NADPH)